MSEWWVQQQGRPSGPITTEALVQSILEGRLPPSTQVCSVTPGSQWAAAQAIPGLQRALNAARAGALMPAAPASYGGYQGAPGGGEYMGPVQAGYGASELPQAGYTPLARKAAAAQQDAGPTRPKSKGPAATAFTAVLALVQIVIFGVSFIILSLREIWTLEGILLLLVSYAIPFVGFCFFAWTMWGIAQGRARAGRRAIKGHYVWGALAVAGGVFCLLFHNVTLGIFLLSSLVFIGLSWFFVRRAMGELTDETF